ncbi:MAG: hypothetical protein IJF67_15400 [Clostridia bacterium]|nr:hypothetical protein [Clostridia bacterium]
MDWMAPSLFPVQRGASFLKITSLSVSIAVLLSKQRNAPFRAAWVSLKCSQNIADSPCLVGLNAVRCIPEAALDGVIDRYILTPMRGFVKKIRKYRDLRCLPELFCDHEESISRAIGAADAVRRMII